MVMVTEELMWNAQYTVNDTVMEEVFVKIEENYNYYGIDSGEELMDLNMMNLEEVLRAVSDTPYGLSTEIEAPKSPTDSWISTDDFPETLEALEPFESDVEIEECTIPCTIKVEEEDVSKDEMFSDEEDEEEQEAEIKHSRPPTRRAKRQSRSFSPSSTFSTSSSEESDPEWEPDHKEEDDTKNLKKNKIKKEPTSDYESEDFEVEVESSPNTTKKKSTTTKTRRPSKHPIPQQRKLGSKLKISQWIVKLLRSPETNPSVMTWENEPKGKFRVTDSFKYAKLWGGIKKNPGMNYEKLSRAMRYYYKNKEIEIVEGERLTYAFGPRMRDFRAKNRNDPNFEKI